MNLRILSLAEADLLTGFQFYERQHPGVGSFFLDSLYSDIESLRLYAGVHRSVYGYHRALAKRFPYGIYYDIRDDEVRVWRVLDCRRDPHWITKQLGSAPTRKHR